MSIFLRVMFPANFISISTKLPQEENVGDSDDNASSINIKIDSAFPFKTSLSTELSPMESLTHSQRFNETPE